MYDVAIIGAGVIGSAIARELSDTRRTSVSSSAKRMSVTAPQSQQCHHPRRLRRSPGFLKGKVKCPRQRMMDALSKDLDIPFKRNGSLVVCTKDQDRSGLDAL